MADIDTLSIQIQASASGATRSVNSLTKSLENLKKAIDSLDVGKINDFCGAVNNLSGAASSLANSADAVKILAKAYKDLDKSGYSVNKAKEATDSLTNSTDGLGSVSASMNQLVVTGNTLATMFERLTSVVSGLNVYEGVSKSFEAISGSCQKLIGEINVFDTTFREIEEPMNQIVAIGTTVATVFERMAVALSALREYADVSGVFAALGGSSQRLIEDLGVIDTTFREIVNPVEEATESMNGFADAVNDAANNTGNGRSLGDETAKGIEGIISSAQKANMAVTSLKAGISGFKDTIKGAAHYFGIFAKQSFSTVTGLKGFKRIADSARGSAKKLGKEITRIAKMLKLMVTRMILRKLISGVTDGFKHLAQYSKEFDGSVSLLWNSFRQLGNSVATAVSPLINAFAPALNTIIQLCIKAVNAINQLLSALTGASTWTRAKVLTDSYAESLNDANKAAKKLKKTVLGFDELNQLQDNNDSGGGTSPLDMFEDVEVDSKWKDFAKWLKSMWDMWDMTDLGKYIGENLLNALENIPWDKIKQKARQIGSVMATLINGIVETEGLGNAIGKTLAEAINTGFEFANEFVHKLNWKSIGKFIGETFNGFFENIDWDLIKDTVVTGFQGLADSLIQFILTFHWDNLSDAISNVVNILATGITEFFNRPMYDERGFKMNGSWASRLGTELGHQIRLAIEKIEWKDVGKAIGSVLQSAIDFVTGMLNTLKWEDFKKAWKELLEGVMEKTDSRSLALVIGGVIGAALLNGIGKLSISAASIYLTEKIKSLVTASAMNTEVEAGATAAGTSIASYIVAGITTFFAGAEIGKKIGAWIKPDDKELYENYSGIIGTLSMLKDTVVAAYDLWVMKAEECWKYLQIVGLLIEAGYLTVAKGVKDAIEEIKRTFTEIKGHIEMRVGEIQTKIKGKVAEIRTDIEDFVKNVKKAFSKDTWTFQGVIDGIQKTFKEALDGAKRLWNKFADKLNGDFEIGDLNLHIGLPKFEGFANGGMPEDGLFMANHGELVGKFSNGKTAVANNKQIVEGISSGVYNAVTAALASSNSGSGDVPVHTTIYIGEEQIARAVTNGQRKIDRRYSPVMA